MEVAGTLTHGPLLREAQQLDRCELQDVPEKLIRLDTALKETSAGNFHAAEESVLRWLLKLMNGTSADAERVRRYPVAWTVMGQIISRMPLFSLAKSLTDRKFMSVLQETLKDASAATDAPTKSAMKADKPRAEQPPDSRKRKRPTYPSFDLDTQRKLLGCLLTVDAVIGSLHGLFHSLDRSNDISASSSQKMGAEHIKSLFCLLAPETLNIIVPLFEACHLALCAEAHEPLPYTSSWVETAERIWDLHLRGHADYLEVAMRTSLRACLLVQGLSTGRELDRSPLHDNARESWILGLRRFLIRNMVLPARTVFLSRKDLEAVHVAVTVADQMAPVSLPVLFDLVVRSSAGPEDLIARKKFEPWVQAMFELLEEPIRNAPSATRSRAIQSMLETASGKPGCLPIDTLKLIIQNYRAPDGEVDWQILRLIAEVDADVFLLSDSSTSLLDEMLMRTKTHSLPAGSSEYGHAVRFVVLLAEASAKARNLLAFLKIWFQYLLIGQSDLIGESEPGNPWLSSELSTAVASVLQSSTTIKQFSQMVDWLCQDEGRTPLENAACVVILASLVDGIQSETFMDTVGLRFYQAAFKCTLPPTLSSAVSWARWHIARNSFTWTSLRESTILWQGIKDEFDTMLGNLNKPDLPAVASNVALEAFKCSAAAWLASIPGATFEGDAGGISEAFLERSTSSRKVSPVALTEMITPHQAGRDLVGVGSAISESRGRSEEVVPESYLFWMLFGQSQFLRLLSDRAGQGLSPPLSVFLDLLFENDDQGNRSPCHDLCRALSGNCLVSESSINDLSLISGVVDRASEYIEATTQRNGSAKGPSTWESSSVKVAVQLLLGTPTEAINRNQRQRLMLALLAPLRTQQRKDVSHLSLSTWKPVVSLMVNLMRAPTFYEGMSIHDLYLVGELALSRAWLQRSQALSRQDMAELEDAIRLFEELATAIFKNVASKLSPGSKEMAFITTANKMLCERKLGPDERGTIVNCLLLKCFILSLQPITQRKGIQKLLSVDAAKESLATDVQASLSAFAKHGHDGDNLTQGYPVLLALVALDVTAAMPQLVITERLGSLVPRLESISNSLISASSANGWKIKIFLARNFDEGRDVLSTMTKTWSAELDRSADTVDGTAVYSYQGLVRYVDSAIENLDDQKKMQLLEKLVSSGKQGEAMPVNAIVAACRVIEQVKEKKTLTEHLISVIDRPGSPLRDSRKPEEAFNLATAHTLFCQELGQTHSLTSFMLIARCLQLLLDSRGPSMTQWNIEMTLSTVSAVALQVASCDDADAAKASSRKYDWLCRLVGSIIKRHRIRLEGHFHLLIVTLQSLLRRLLRNPYNVPHDAWEKQAKHYARLLTLVCEPTAASVARSQANALNSATDAAKRSAGQHMYLVLMGYVKLQLEYAVPRGVRRALEPGLYAILDITKPEVRRIASEGMNAGGRVIFKEMYQEYVRFGKWTGV